MNVEPPSKDHVRAEDAPEDHKYHPLILQNTFHNQLSAIVDGINLREKHDFLQKLRDSFKDILSCSKCGSILGETFIGFCCGHSFCDKCVKNPDSCLSCQDDGYTSGSKITNLSGILDNLKEIKNNFNRESVLVELIKFLFTPASMIMKREPRIRDEVDGSTPVLPSSDSCTKKPHAKFTTTGKRFKTMSDKTDNTKRKLLFNRDVADTPTRTQLLENDSESLFIDSSKRNKPSKNENKVTSYLEMQSSVDESPKFDANNVKTYSRSAKRKLACSDLTSNAPDAFDDMKNSVPESSLKKRKMKAGITELNVDKTPPKTENSSKRKERSSRNRRISDISDGSANGENTKGAVELRGSESCTPDEGTRSRRASKRISSKISLDELPSTKSEGTFSGFQQTHLTDSYNKLLLMSKYYNRKFRDDKVQLKMSAEEDDSNMFSNVLDREKIPTGVLDSVGVSNHNGADDNCVKVIDYDKKKKRFSVKRRSCRIGEHQDMQTDGEVSKELEEDQSLTTKMSTDVLDKEHKVKNPLADKLRPKNEIKTRSTSKSRTKRDENDNLERNNSCEIGKEGILEVLNTTYHVDSSLVGTKADKKCDVAPPSASCKGEKENFNVNYSDVEAEDVVDINLWDREDKATRKRKSLFKAVKERNKKNVLLKLLEEKALQREKENKENSQDLINNLSSKANVGITAPAADVKLTDGSSTSLHENECENSSPEAELVPPDHQNSTSLRDSECENSSPEAELVPPDHQNMTSLRENECECPPKAELVSLDHHNSLERTNASAIDAACSSTALKVVSAPTSEPGTSSSTVSSYIYTPLLPEENVGLPTPINSSRPSQDCFNSSIGRLYPPVDCRGSPKPPAVFKISVPRLEDVTNIPPAVRETPENSYACSTSPSRDNQCRSADLIVSLERLDSSYDARQECDSRLSSSQRQCESMPTPVSKRSKFVYSVDRRLEDSPQSAGMCSPVMDPESASVSAGVLENAVPNTSTPIVDKYLKTAVERSDYDSTSWQSNIVHGPEKLPARSACLKEQDGEESPGNASSSSIIIKTQRSSCEPTGTRRSELAEALIGGDNVPSEIVAKMNVKLKCANLKRVINEQNQKSLVSLQKNFGVVSPPVLSIAKCKLEKLQSPVEHDASPPTLKPPLNHLDDKCKADLSMEEWSADLKGSDSPLNKIQNLPSLSELDDVLTMPSSPAKKSVACQTTTELHVALLIQEFPHLFQRSNLPLSVYDTPVESTIASCKDEGAVPVKTPDIRTSLLGQHDRFTRVSSVTSSEKKLFEKEFAERSVLCDSFRTPASGIGVVNEHADISCISLLPSSGKKAPEFNSQDSEKRKLSVRLNFQDVESRITSRGEAKSPAIDALENAENVISVHDTTYCSGLKSTSSSNSTLQDASNREVEGEKQNRLSCASNEIEFTEGSPDQQEKSAIVTKQNSMNEDKGENLSMSVVVDTNISIIPDTNVPVEEDVEIFTDDEPKEKYVERSGEVNGRKYSEAVYHKSPDAIETNGYKSPEVNMDVDDEDVDFVAGTPTCYSKRCLDSSFEMIRSQSMITRPSDSEEISAADKSNLLFDSLDCRTLKSQPSNLNVVQKGPVRVDASSKCSNDLSQVSVPSKVSTVKSVDLFCSDSMTSTTVCVYMTTSGLKEADNRIVKLFCEKFSAVLLDKLTDKSTHLVVKTDATNQTSRTFKYLQAIVNCVRIVSINWLYECLRQGCMVDEESFIPLDSSGECGPLRAFNVTKNVTPSPLSWLRDYCVFFVEPVPQGCTLSQLQEIIARAGAVVVNSLKEMKKYPSHHRVIIVSEDDENVETSNEEIANWLQMYQAVAIEFNWLLEVIGRNRLVPFADYEVVEIPDELLLRLNFPSDMLQVENQE